MTVRMTSPMHIKETAVISQTITTRMSSNLAKKLLMTRSLTDEWLGQGRQASLYLWDTY